MISEADKARIQILVDAPDVQCAVNKLAQSARDTFDGLNAWQKFELVANWEMAKAQGIEDTIKMISLDQWTLPSGVKEGSRAILEQYNAFSPETQDRLNDLNTRLAKAGEGISLANVEHNPQEIMDAAADLSPVLEPLTEELINGLGKKPSPACNTLSR